MFRMRRVESAEEVKRYYIDNPGSCWPTNTRHAPRRTHREAAANMKRRAGKCLWRKPERLRHTRPIDRREVFFCFFGLTVFSGVMRNSYPSNCWSTDIDEGNAAEHAAMMNWEKWPRDRPRR